jgi:3-deoxy-manno-octulosonate cytidylyltransferase (CMP-KDO synthetase)
MDPTPLEMVEAIDMMRVLENGFNVKMIPTNFITSAVDTKEDLARVSRLMSEQA